MIVLPISLFGCQIDLGSFWEMSCYTSILKPSFG